MLGYHSPCGTRRRSRTHFRIKRCEGSQKDAISSREARGVGKAVSPARAPGSSPFHVTCWGVKARSNQSVMELIKVRLAGALASCPEVYLFSLRVSLLSGIPHSLSSASFSSFLAHLVQVSVPISASRFCYRRLPFSPFPALRFQTFVPPSVPIHLLLDFPTSYCQHPHRQRWLEEATSRKRPPGVPLPASIWFTLLRRAGSPGPPHLDPTPGLQASR